MLRTEFEDAVLNDVYAWYATQDTGTSEVSDEIQNMYPASHEEIIRQYWENYFGPST